MNIEAGLQLVIFLILFGSLNYVIMLKRYENDIKQKKISQFKKIASLYPKNTFLNI